MLRIFLLALISVPCFAASLPPSWEICGYLKGEFVCRNFDPSRDGRVVPASSPVVAQATTTLPPPSVTVVSEVESVDQVPESRNWSPSEPQPSRTWPPLVPSSSGASSSMRMGPYVPVSK